MKQVYDAILACRADSGKLAKQAILQKLVNDADAKEFFRICYEPKINFYQKTITTVAGLRDWKPCEFNLPLIYRVVQALGTREVSGNDAKAWLSQVYDGLSYDWERELLIMLIERDVKAGFGVNTINLVWPDLITDVPYMRCSLPKDAKLDLFPWSRGVFSQIKADGMFANISHLDNGDIRIESRNGSPFPIDAFPDLVESARTQIPRGMQTHGELLMLEKKGGDYETLARQIGNGMFNKLLQGGDIDRSIYTPVYEAWDIIPLSEARPKNKMKASKYSDRFAALQRCIPVSHTMQFLSIIETKIVYSMQEAKAHYQEALARGLEGTIIKNPDMIWEDSTSKHQVKMKLEFECELRVVGFNPGSGKNAKTFGSLQCETEDGLLKVGVHGFSDDLRLEIHNDRDGWLNGIITAKSNSIMPPTNKGHYSLFLPIFVERRLDKRTADTLERVIEQFNAATAA